MKKRGKETVINYYQVHNDWEYHVATYSGSPCVNNVIFQSYWRDNNNFYPKVVDRSIKQKIELRHLNAYKNAKDMKDKRRLNTMSKALCSSHLRIVAYWASTNENIMHTGAWARVHTHRVTRKH